MPQKKSFGPKNSLISCTGSKVPFWQFLHSAKMALLNLFMKLKKKLAKRLLLMRYESAIYRVVVMFSYTKNVAFVAFTRVWIIFTLTASKSAFWRLPLIALRFNVD